MSADRIRRARSSRKWSDSAIRPSAPTGLRGLPRRTSTTPTKDTGPAALAQVPSGGGVVARRRLALGSLLRLEGGTLRRLTGLELELRVRLLARLGLILVQTLGLGLEDAEGAAAATSQLGQLGSAEHQDDDRQDDEQLWRAEVADQQG